MSLSKEQTSNSLPFGTVYLVINLINDKTYVGQTKSPLRYRLKQHLYDAGRGKNYHFLNAIKQHGACNFSISALGYADTQGDLDQLERLWIALLNSSNPQCGYNSTLGGGIGLPNLATRKKLSIAGKKRYADPSERLKTSIRMFNALSSPEARKQKSDAAKKAASSPSAKIIRSEAAKKVWADENRRHLSSQRSYIRTSNPEWKKSQSEKMRRSWLDPEVRARRIQGLKANKEAKHA
jgi:group I intron endonuclease